MKKLRNIWRRHQKTRPRSEGEEYEIEKAQREARDQGQRFGESLIEKAGHRQYPYLKDPFE